MPMEMTDTEYYRSEVIKLVESAKEYSDKHFRDSPAAVVGHMTATLNIIESMTETYIKEA